MDALIAGFGSIGCRHAQALLASGKYGTIHVVEPSDLKFEEGLARIGTSRDDVARHRDLAGFSAEVDVAIIATSSEPRFRIMEDLIPRNIPFFLVEKIVFQSLAQFDRILPLLRKAGSKGYCNFTNRYFANYIDLRKRLTGRSTPVSMTVTGGDLGLGSNAIHYMDLFEYLTGSPLVASGSSLTPWEKENKRGPSYREFSGYMTARTAQNDLLRIFFDPSHQGGVTLSFDFDKETLLLSEGAGIEIRGTGDAIERHPFTILPTSRLTDRIVEDMRRHSCPLTTMEETRNTHGHLFAQANRALNLPNKEDTLCPVT